MKRRITLFLLFFVPLAVALCLDILLAPRTSTDFAVKWWHTVLTRALFSCSTAALILYSDLSLFRPVGALRAPRSLAFCTVFAAFAVACNNLPFVPLFSGAAQVNAPLSDILLFALGCLAIGVFEELLFRGLLLARLLRRFSATPRGRLAAILISSALFGLVHLFNLAAGANPARTLLQVGYSFLIGCLMAVLLLASGRLLLPILCHALYDFTGRLVPECGTGALWDTPTTVLTLVLSLAAAAVVLCFLWQNAKGARPDFEKCVKKEKET